MRLILFLLCLLLLAAPAVAAQNVIQVGQTVTGELGESDPEDEDGARYDVYRFRGQAEEWYSITLQSTEFDAYLRVGSRPGPDCEDDGECQANDDGGGGLDAQVLFQPREDGRYEIHVSSFGPDVGRYTLTLEHAVMDTMMTMDTTAVWMDSSAVWMGEDTVTVPVAVPMQDTVWAADTIGWADTDSVVVDGSLFAGAPAYGILEPGADLADGGIPYDEMTYAALAGETVTVTLYSEDFDALLVLGRWNDGERWEELARDDDSGDDTNAELRYTFDEEGLYTLRATAYNAEAAGVYTLLLESDMAGEPWETTTDTVVGPMEPLAYGQTVHGRMEDGDPNYSGPYFDLYVFSGRAGETVTITLESDDFDAYLYVAPASTGEKLATDDDGGEGTNARVTVTLPETGEYLVRATSFADDQQGAYTLRLDRS